MSAITAKASRKMKKYAVLTREPRCFLGSFDFSWEQRKLGELVDRVVRKNTNNESTLPLTISAQYGLVDQITYFNNRVASRDVSNYYLVLNGEFAYNKSTSDGYPFGAVKRLDLYEKGVLSTLYIVFAPKKEQQIDSDYLTVFFDTDRWHKGVAERAAEGARNHGLLNISAEDFFDIDLSVPKDIVEQKQIGAFIRQLDNLITLHQRKCVFLFGFFQAFISMIFTASTFSWEQRKVGDLLIERNQQAPMSDEYPLMAFIANEGVAPKGERYDRSALVTDTVNKLYKKTEKGDFIYSSNNLETGSIGLNKYGKACISPVYSIFEPTGIADSDFLGRRLVRKDFINAMVKWRQGVIYGQWRIHESDFLKIEITVPSVEEQRKIGAYLDQLDNLITLHQRECISFTARAGRRILTANKKRNTSSWEQRKLGEIGSVSMCRRIFKEQTSETGDIPFYKIGTFGADPDAFISRELFEEYKSKYPYPQKGDILISASGSIGRAVEFAGNNEYFQDSNIVWLNHDERLSNPFLKCFYSVVKWAGIEGSTIKRLYNDNILNTVICMPSVPEQKRIGLFFENLDNLITLHQRKFEKLTNVKKSMLEKMFPQNGSSYPEIRFKGFTDPWEQRKFEEIAVRSSVICSDDTLPRVEYEDIVSGTGRLNKDIYAKQSIKSGIAFHQGDVLYGKLRPYLQNWLLPTFDGLAVGDFWVLQPQNADSSFLYRLIQSRQFDEVANQSTGTKMPRADWKLVSKTVFSIPSNISEQAAIGTYFTALDSLITLHQRELEKLQNIKKSMLEKMFV